VKKLALVSLLLVITLVSVSAYLRLDNSGIGCADWPECYGRIGAAEVTEPTVGSTYERLAVDARQPLSWGSPVHRLVASVLGLTVLGMALLSLRVKRDRLIAFTLLGLTVFLAWLGIYSGGLHNPAIVMGNLGGGFTMLGLLGWMAFRDAKPSSNAPLSTKTWTTAALVWLMFQIMIGGLTGANFAASACQTLPDCHGSYLPGSNLSVAFDISRTHEIGPTGLAIGGSERADIHKLHRISAVITAATILIAGFSALQAGLGWNAMAILLLVVAEFGVGIAAIVTEIPIGVATAHNGLAAMLLLGLLRLFALCNNRQALL
jgi:cytochrome c oxidase assembly protein subunit 15